MSFPGMLNQAVSYDGGNLSLQKDGFHDQCTRENQDGPVDHGERTEQRRRMEKASVA